jgi:hypothetical protein
MLQPSCHRVILSSTSFHAYFRYFSQKNIRSKTEMTRQESRGGKEDRLASVPHDKTIFLATESDWDIFPRWYRSLFFVTLFYTETR